MNGMQVAVSARVTALDRLLRSHGGGLALDGVDADGAVRVRFTGMCTGCELRPHTAATVIEPALGCLQGVTQVAIAGGRISREAQERLAASTDAASRAALLEAIVHIEHAQGADR